MKAKEQNINTKSVVYFSAPCLQDVLAMRTEKLHPQKDVRQSTMCQDNVKFRRQSLLYKTK